MELSTIVLYLLIPVAATIFGGVVTGFYTPGAQVRSGVQHFAAGLVFAAVASELLPDMLERHAIIAMIGGFSIGVLAMLGITAVTEAKGQKGLSVAGKVIGLLVIAGVNFLVDGLLIGIGFAIGGHTGLLLSIALAIESLFLSLAVTSALRAEGGSATRSIVATAGFAGLLVIGALAGATLFSGVAGGWLVFIIAFGVAALLYLVTEELLVEAHEQHNTENALTASLFFVGFLLLLVLESSISAGS